MPFILVIIGAIIVITAYRGTHGQLGDALAKDIPGFLKWGMAIAAILGLGFIPGFKTPSRWLLALVLLVIVLTQYKAILAGVASFSGTSGTAGSAAQDTSQGSVAQDPTTVGATGSQSPASLSGTAPAGSPPTVTPPPNMLDPQTYLNMVNPAAGFGGTA